MLGRNNVSVYDVCNSFGVPVCDWPFQTDQRYSGISQYTNTIAKLNRKVLSINTTKMGADAVHHSRLAYWNKLCLNKYSCQWISKFSSVWQMPCLKSKFPKINNKKRRCLLNYIITIGNLSGYTKKDSTIRRIKIRITVSSTALWNLKSVIICLHFKCIQFRLYNSSSQA